MSGENKYKLSFIFIVCFFAFFIFFLTSPSESYYTPGPYPYYPPPAGYSSPPPINMNINLGGFSGSYATGYPNYMRYPPSGYIGGASLYGNPWMGYLPTTQGSIKASTSKFFFRHSDADGNYIFVIFSEKGGRDRAALAIFEDSGSGDLEYISYVTLYKGYDSSDLQSIPVKIIVKDDLAVIGGDDLGMVYLVDISEKDDPKLVNKLILDNETADDGDSNEVTGLAIEDDVLFVSVWFGGEESRIYAVDISDPPRTDEVDDLLDSYTIDDYEAYGILSVPDYLFVPGNDNGEESILIIDASNPRHLFLEEKFYDLEGSDLSAAIAGDYLFATLDISDSPLYGNPASELQIFDISDPEDPDMIYTSEEMIGRQFFGTGFIAVKDNYAYVLSATGQGESRIYVYDISDPEDADLVEIKKLSSGSGYEVHLANDMLFVHIVNQGIVEVIDISEPEDLSVEGTVDLSEILEEEDDLDDWGNSRYTVPSYVYPPYGYSYSPPPLYTPPMAVGYNSPYRTLSGGLWNSPNYSGYAQPLYGGNPNFAPGFSFNYGQPPYGGYPNFGPLPGFGYAQPPYYSGWRGF